MVNLSKRWLIYLRGGYSRPVPTSVGRTLIIVIVIVMITYFEVIVIVIYNLNVEVIVIVIVIDFKKLV